MLVVIFVSGGIEFMISLLLRSLFRDDDEQSLGRVQQYFSPYLQLDKIHVSTIAQTLLIKGMCGVPHRVVSLTDSTLTHVTCDYIQLCHFYKQTLVLTCLCQCRVWCPCLCQYIFRIGSNFITCTCTYQLPKYLYPYTLPGLCSLCTYLWSLLSLCVFMHDYMSLLNYALPFSSVNVT